MTESKRISIEGKNLVNRVTSLKRNVGISVHKTVKLGFCR